MSCHILERRVQLHFGTMDSQLFTSVKELVVLPWNLLYCMDYTVYCTVLNCMHSLCCFFHHLNVTFYFLLSLNNILSINTYRLDLDDNMAEAQVEDGAPHAQPFHLGCLDADLVNIYNYFIGSVTFFHVCLSVDWSVISF